MILATLATRNWYEYVATSIASVICNNDNFLLYLFIEDDEFPYFKWDKRIIVKNFNKMPNLLKDNSPNLKECLYPRISFLPFLLPFYLDEDKVIFFDSDVVFDGSLQELWDTDMSNVPIALVPEEKKSKDAIYGNMGVALMNLELIRSNGVAKTLLNKLNTEYYTYICQDIVNEVCKGDIKPLDNKWNATLWTGFPDKIIGCHGAGAIKPWDKRSRYYETYNKYKEKT